MLLSANCVSALRTRSPSRTLFLTAFVCRSASFCSASLRANGKMSSLARNSSSSCMPYRYGASRPMSAKALSMIPGTSASVAASRRSCNSLPPGPPMSLLRVCDRPSISKYSARAREKLSSRLRARLPRVYGRSVLAMRSGSVGRLSFSNHTDCEGKNLVSLLPVQLGRRRPSSRAWA